MRLVAYCRVSTLGQVKDGLGIPTQQRLVREWAKRNGHKLVKIVDENGKSGMLAETERPGLLEVLGMLARHEADGVVVTSIDRLARSLTVQEGVLGKVWAMGRTAFTVDGGEVPRDDPDDPMRTAMRQMSGVFAQLDRALVVKRLRNGRATKKASGGYAQGGPPYGMRAEDGALVRDEEEQAVIADMVQWRRNGMALAAIARTLNERGTSARRGRWHPTTVKRVLQREGVDR